MKTNNIILNNYTADILIIMTVIKNMERLKLLLFFPILINAQVHNTYLVISYQNSVYVYTGFLWELWTGLYLI